MTLNNKCGLSPWSFSLDYHGSGNKYSMQNILLFAANKIDGILKRQVEKKNFQDQNFGEIYF